MTTGIVLCLMVVWSTTYADRQFPMDRKSTCGKTVRLGEEPVVVTARSKISTSYARKKCILKLQAAVQQNARNRVEIVIRKVNIQDCGMKLEIYDHDGPIGSVLKSIGCGYSSLGQLYSDSHIVTLKLTRPTDVFNFISDFELEFKAYSDGGDGASVIGTTRLKSWMIAIIVIGIVIVIAATLFLLCMCAHGLLPGMTGPPATMRRVRVLRSAVQRRPAVGGKYGVDNPAVRKSTDSLHEQNGGFKNAGFGAGLGAGLGASQRGPTDDKPRVYLQAAEPRLLGRAAKYQAANKSVDIGGGNGAIEAFRDTARAVGKGDASPHLKTSGSGALTGDSGGQTTAGNGASRPQFFKNPDAEGYHYSYDHLHPEDGRTRDETVANPSQSENRPRRRQQRLADQRKDAESSGGSKETNIDDPSGGSTSMEETASKGREPTENDAQELSEHQSAPVGQQAYEGQYTPEYYASIDQHSEPNQSGTMSNPLHATNGAIRARVDSSEELERDDSRADPRGGRKRLSKKPAIEKTGGQKFHFPFPNSAKDSSNSYDGPRPNNHDPDLDNAHRGASPAFNSILSRTTEQNAPPTYMYTFETPARGDHPPPEPVAGKAAWFMHTTPSRDGPVTQGGLIVQSEPSNPQHHPHAGHKPKAKSAFSAFQPPPSHSDHRNHRSVDDRLGQQPDHVTLPTAHGQHPGTRTASVKTGVDPRSGNQVSQAVWTDNNPDRMDPMQVDNPSINRQTVSRVTTNAGHNPIPDNAYPLTNQLSFHNQALRDDPSRVVFGGQPMIAETPSAYGREYPQHENAAYHRGDNSGTIIHDAPKKSRAIRDKINVSDI